jgi:chorismate dehydratase
MRIAAIRYINALPLIYGLERNATHQILLTTPSLCFEKLLTGQVDIALIPVFATQTLPRILALSGLGIAAENRTESVYLITKKQPDQIQSAVTDPASLTSTTLLKIILQEKYGSTPAFLPNTYASIPEALQDHDAALVIGDEAILAQKLNYEIYDLATEWHAMTGLPFIFAVWASSRPLENSESFDLYDSYEQATQNWDEVCLRAGHMLHVDGTFLKRYYNNNLHYRLTERDYEGFRRFIHLAVKLKIIQQGRDEIWM